jgi:hypothetical protein
MTPAKLLRSWISRGLGQEGLAWLDETCAAISGGAPDRVFFTRFSAALRHVGKEDLELSPEDRKPAHEARPGWDPTGWTREQAARALIVLSLPSDDREAWRRTLESTFRSADLGEAVALYRTLPLLPHPDLMRARGAEGIRTNMRPVFEGLAHRSPFPAEQFEEGTWNQMVLKALFIGSRLFPIQRLDERANETLMLMLLDYARERRAARRDVSPELWRCVGPFANDEGLSELSRLIQEGDEAERRAAALSLAACPRGGEALAGRPELADAVKRGELRWEDL